MNQAAKDGKGTFSQALEWAALLAVIHYCFFRFFEASTFYFDFTGTYRKVTFAAMVALGLMRLRTGLRADFYGAETGREKRKTLWKGALALLCAVPCVWVAHRFKYTFLAYLPFVAYCLYGTKADKVLKTFTIAIGTILLATIICSLTGAVENYLYLSAKGKLRGSYGVSYPTDFASYFIYLFAFVWAQQKKHAWWHTGLFVLLGLGMCWLLRMYPHSDTSTILSLVCVAIVLYDALDHRVLSRHRGTRCLSKAGEGLVTWAFPILGAVFFSIVLLYGRGYGFAVRLDRWISSRFSLVWQHYLKYGVNAFGALTPQNGAGHGLIHTETYEFLDSTYGLILIRYGWILTGIFTGLWVWMTHRAYKTDHRRLALAMAIIAIHSFSEHHFTELNFNILLAMPLCVFGAGKKPQTEEGPERIRKKRTLRQAFAGSRVPWIMAAVLCALVALLLPRAFSWMRTLFFLQGWNGGGLYSLAALLFCLFCFGILAVVWLAVSFMACSWIREKKISPLMILGMVTVFIGVSVVVSQMDETIRDGMEREEMQSRIAAEREAVETVLSAAEEPVYGGEIEEIYKRNFDGFSDHLFSDMELGRSARGTILLGHNNEGYQLINTGAKYTELSPFTGLFTYDDAVIEALQAEGYRFHGYFSGEQSVDLTTLGPVNGLGIAETGELMLWGVAHSLIHGPYYDQYSGSYQVTFRLILRDLDVRTENPDREVCLLRASALWGQNIRAERTVTISDFDEDGRLAVSLNYSVNSTRGVEYLVFCRENIPVWIDGITVRRIQTSDIWRTYTPEGYVETERYFTTEGEPLAQSTGHYGAAYEYANGNGSWTKLCYLDADGKTLKTISSGYAQIVRGYNVLRQVTEERYLDPVGIPCLCTGNYAGYRRVYDEAGNVLTQEFFDTDGQPIRSTGGYVGVEYGYDERNNRISERYLDEEGRPLLLGGGYAEIRREYNTDRRVIRETYYDESGIPVALSKNQAGVAYEYDEAGNTICWRYLDTEGNPVLLTDGWAELHRAYNEKRQIIEESYYGTDGKPLLRPTGYAYLERWYDNIGNVAGERYLDTERHSIRNTSGYAEFRRIFNSDNRVVLEEYFDEEGNPCNAYDRYAAIRSEYAVDGALALNWYTDAKGNPVECGSGWFHKYLQSLRGRNITIFITVRDEATNALTGVLLEDLKAIGVRTDLKGKYHYSYYAVITPDGSKEDASITETISHSGAIGGIPYTVTSGGYAVGNTSSVLIGGEEYSKNSRGTNFVILDNETSAVIESIGVDTYAQEMRVTR